MTARPSNRGFAARPGDPDTWVRTPEPSAAPHGAGDLYTARLTIDVTPALRGRIKITAFQRGLTVADMLRALLAREFPATMEDRHDGESAFTSRAMSPDTLTHVELIWLEKRDRALDPLRPRRRRDRSSIAAAAS